jgi:hypothetical protein
MPKILDLGCRWEIQDFDIDNFLLLARYGDAVPYYITVEFKPLGLEGIHCTSVRQGSDLWMWLEERLKGYLSGYGIHIEDYVMEKVIPPFDPSDLPKVQFKSKIVVDDTLDLDIAMLILGGKMPDPIVSLKNFQVEMNSGRFFSVRDVVFNNDRKKVSVYYTDARPLLVGGDFPVRRGSVEFFDLENELNKAISAEYFLSLVRIEKDFITLEWS